MPKRLSIGSGGRLIVEDADPVASDAQAEVKHTLQTVTHMLMIVTGKQSEVGFRRSERLASEGAPVAQVLTCATGNR
jgi:hypothetical protein